jgi:hypothetical protein
VKLARVDFPSVVFAPSNKLKLDRLDAERFELELVRDGRFVQARDRESSSTALYPVGAGMKLQVADEPGVAIPTCPVCLEPYAGRGATCSTSCGAKLRHMKEKNGGQQ